MKAVWEELDSLNMIPVIAAPTPEIVKLLDAINLLKEESRLFQFLNGLDEQYNSQRSQLLLQIPLPTVEVACSALEQEEAQRAMLNLGTSGSDLMAMFSKVSTDKPVVVCTVCGVKGHHADKCWQIVGYPRWHPRFSKYNTGTRGVRKPYVQNTQQSGKWQQSSPKPVPQHQKFAANAQTSEVAQMFTPQQLEQLAQLMATIPSKQSETDDEIDYHFSGMISCFNASGSSTEWIVDSGASDHMTSHLSTLVNAATLAGTHNINLPTGEGVILSQKGQVHLTPTLTLNDVLCVPSFKHNLLSVQRLLRENNCVSQFFPTYCVVYDKLTKQIHATGVARNGLYYINSASPVNTTYLSVDCNAATATTESDLALWHHRLSHASISSLKHISCIKQPNSHQSTVCVSCPMSKFTRLSFS